METSIRIIHEVTSYKERIKYNILLFIGAVSFCGILSFIDRTKNDGLFLIIISVLIGLIILYKIYQQRLYLADFISDSKTVNIVYFNGSKEQKLETLIDDVDVKLKNTTRRAGFNCELIIYIDELKFTIDKDFDWSFTEMIKLFKFVKFHQNTELTESEKFIISSMEEYLKRIPF